MANATAAAQCTTTPWGLDVVIKRDLAGSTAATYYPGTMIAINASGYAVKCDDTAGLRFDGIQADSFRIETLSTDAAGDKKVNVEKPTLFTMKIASAAITDVGRTVYAKFDNEVAYSGVTNNILVGTVEAYVNATSVQVRPYWAGSGNSTSGVGYVTGAGGAVTQLSSRTTTVVLNTLCGAITTDVSSLAAGAEAEFTVTNSQVAATDTVIVCLKTESTTGTSVPFVTTVAAGSFKITLTNLHATTADTSASVINFAIIKAAAS